MTLVAVLCCAALAFCPVATASMQVTATGDGGGVCTLREAIEAVNANNSGTGCGPLDSGTTRIDLPANHYTPTDGQLVVEGHLEIVGGDENAPGQTVIDAGASRVMEVKVGGSAKLVSVEITGGRTGDGGLAPDIYHAYAGGYGGGILNHGTLILENALVTENQTGDGSQGANAPLRYPGGGGGQGGSGGGIFNDVGAYLLVLESTISKNFTGDGGNGGEGADGEVPENGHYPSGTPGGRGGAAGDGGGIYNAGNAVIEDSTIEGNFTGRGGNGGNGGHGAGYHTPFGPGEGGDGGDGGNNGKQYRKDQGTFWDEERGGGGIYSAGPLTIANSTISGNATGAGGNGGSSGPGGQQELGGFEDSGRAGTGGGGGRGGGLLTAMAPGAQVFLTNVTIFGNLTGDGGIGGGGGGGAESTLGGGVGGWGGDGGGIFTHGAKSGSEMTLMQVTIAGNGLGAGGPSGSSADPSRNASGSERGVGAGIATGGRYDAGGSAVYEKNSIIANNGSNIKGDANCYQRYLPTYTDIYDLGNNVTWNDLTCPGKVADPLLGLFGDNGGPTKTLVPGSGGSAIGAVPSAFCTVDEDQRGEPRPGAGKSACDAGAVETQSGEPPNEEGGGEEGGKEEGGSETPGTGSPGGGGSSGGSSPGGSSPPPPTLPAPAPKPQLHCRKGFTKKVVKGKPRCVKKKRHHRRHRHP